METFIRSQTLRFGACSKHVTVTDNGRIAAKNNPKIQYADGVVYSASPLNGTVEFEVKITSYGTPWSGNIKIGVAKFRVGKSIAEVPRYSPEAPGHCVWSSDTLYKGGAEERQYGSIDLDSLREGDRVGLSLSHDGKLTFSVNGQSQGLAAQGVYEQGYDVYAVVDLYGNCRAIGVCAPNRKQTQSSSVESEECPPKKMKGGLCEYPQLPGIVFSDTSTPREVTISTKATRIDENGFSLSVPDNAVNRDVQLSIATSFSDSFEVPKGIESVSPTYLIGTTTMIEFSKDVDLILQHTANVRTDEDCKDMVVMKASVCDSDRGKFSYESGNVTFVKEGRVGILKLRNLETASYKIGRRKKDEDPAPIYFSARLYKAVVRGRLLEAVFCMCPDLHIYERHCDAFVAKFHPEMSQKSRRTFINALSFKSKQVSLKTEDALKIWQVNYINDKRKITKLEVNYPLEEKLSLSDLADYPPHIRLQLAHGKSERPVSTLLKILGLNEDCSFEVSSDDLSFSSVVTTKFKDAVEEFKHFMSLQITNNSLAACAEDITHRMEKMEPQLRDFRILRTLGFDLHPKFEGLLDSVKDIQGLTRNVIEAAKNESQKIDTGTVIKLLDDFKKLSPRIAKELSSDGDVVSLRMVIGELMNNCDHMMKSTMELFKLSAPLHMDPNFPGHILSQPSQQAKITSRGKNVDLESTSGLSLSVSKGAVAEDVTLSVATGFSGGPELPDDVESVSPAYLFKTVTTIEFSKDVSLKLQHAANLETAEGCKDMVVLQASIDPSQGSGQVYKQVEGTTIEFSEEENFGVVKITSLFSSCYKIGKRKHNGSPATFYSARLYKYFAGIKVTAVFCVCQKNVVYTKYCDRVISKDYPYMDKKTDTTLKLASDKIGLEMVDNDVWVITFDRSEISKKEIHSPERMKMDVSKLNDFPPRIRVNLTSISATELIPSAELIITGSEDENSFFISNQVLLNKSVNTKELLEVTHKLEDEVMQLSDAPLVTYALEVVAILYEIEPLLLHTDLDSTKSLIKKVKDLEQLSGIIVQELGATKVDVAEELRAISQELKKMASVLSMHSVSGLQKTPEEMLIDNCKDLVHCTMKLLEGEVRDVTSISGVSLKLLHIIEWSEGQFRLFERVCDKWKDFGIMLKIEYNLLNAWEKECNKNAIRCWDKVMSRWLEGTTHEDYPATWNGLYHLLNNLEYAEVTTTLKKIVSEKTSDST